MNKSIVVIPILAACTLLAGCVGTGPNTEQGAVTGGALGAKRSVLKRSERIAKMVADKKFDSKKNKPLGLPKTLTGTA